MPLLWCNHRPRLTDGTTPTTLPLHPRADLLDGACRPIGRLDDVTRAHLDQAIRYALDIVYRRKHPTGTDHVFDDRAQRRPNSAAWAVDPGTAD